MLHAEPPHPPRIAYCIGAQKAGTTWIYEALRQSPEVHFSKCKEIHYFDVLAGKAKQVVDLRVNIAKNLTSSLKLGSCSTNSKTLNQLSDLVELLALYSGNASDHSAYLRYLLKDHEKQPVICDITPAYAVLDNEMYAQMDRLGDAKFFFIMRDPVDRMWSQIRMAVKKASPTMANFQADCEAHAKKLLQQNRLPRIERSDYRRTITELEKAVPQERILYIFYETLFQEKTLNKLSSFLGISPFIAKLDTLSNMGAHATIPAEIKRKFQISFKDQYDYCFNRFGKDVPIRWRKNCPESEHLPDNVRCSL